ncbi:2063_t:CDS:2 [Ambispora leptoticha]|uniref:2063_t:CDS:1 n=1 Tax=Ambispora leptoticha TaxID=144679 RepID=A0A9N8WH45_9GLOM|nr:2063_t:CDS:2 [Ambispora leptoticha]
MPPVPLKKLVIYLTLLLVLSTIYLLNGFRTTISYSPLPSQPQRLVVFLDGIQQANSLQSIIYKFNNDIHKDSLQIIVSGGQRGLSRSGMNALMARDGLNWPNNIIDLNIGEMSWSSSENKINPVIQVFKRFSKLLEKLKPEVVIYVKDPADPVSRGVTSVLSNFENITGIGLPLDHIEHLAWLPDLTIDTLKHWNTPKFHLQVITQDRPDSLSRLLRSLDSSYYLGDRLPLTINMDRGADPVTLDYCNKFQWNHGDLALRHRVLQGGLLPAVVESYYPHNSDHYAVLLEDDIEVSPFFYVWLKYSVLKYRYGPDRAASQRMFGVSLYNPNSIELHMSGRRDFDPSLVLEQGNFPKRSPYLNQVPCSWGAVYFPEIWREFHEYINARMDDEVTINIQKIAVPESRSNRWRKSWKRYFIELAYLRGYVMLYPNFSNFTSLSTNHMEAGTHIHSNNNKPLPVRVFDLPLMWENIILKELPQGRLSEFESLPVTDFWGNLETAKTLIDRGHALHMQVSDCPPQVPLRYSAEDLLCVDEDDKAEAWLAYKEQQKEQERKYAIISALADRYASEESMSELRRLDKEKRYFSSASDRPNP